MGVFALYGGLGAEHRHVSGLRCCAGRLDRRHGADKRHAVGRAQMCHHRNRHGVAGDHHKVGPVRGDQFTDQRHDPCDDRVFAVVAVGKEHVVGDIDKMRVGAHPDDLTQDGETAEAGIEQENRREGWHVAILADPGGSFSCYCMARRLRRALIPLQIVSFFSHNFRPALLFCGIWSPGHPCRKISFCCRTEPATAREACSRPMSGDCMQLLDLSNPEQQVAFYDDGVGTSSFKLFAILGGIFGFGLKRNVIAIYSFCCRNYRQGDRIYCFGFSRGAFTIRIVAGMIASAGACRLRRQRGRPRALRRRRLSPLPAAFYRRHPQISR